MCGVLLAQVEYARGVLRRLAGDLAENRELAVFSLERAIRDYEVRLWHALTVPFFSCSINPTRPDPTRRARFDPTRPDLT